MGYSKKLNNEQFRIEKIMLKPVIYNNFVLMHSRVRKLDISKYCLFRVKATCSIFSESFANLHQRFKQHPSLIGPL